MPDQITQLASRLKPIIMAWINDASGGGGGSSTQPAGSYVPTTRRVTAGDGLTGGGQLTANVTLTVGAGDGIDVAADTVSVDVTDIIDTDYGLEDNGNNIRINLSSISGLTFDSGELEINDAISSSGITIVNKRISVGQGDGLVIGASTVGLIAPGSLSEATANTAACNHLHTILSSSNPGTSSSLLHSGSVGELTLSRLNVDSIYDKSGCSLTFYATASLVADKNFVPSITASKHLGSSTRLWDEVWTNKTYFGTTGLLQNAGTNIIGLGTGDSLRSSDYISNVSGWAIESNGSAEFLNLNVRGEIHSAVFVKDLIDARAGTMLVAKSAGVIATLAASVPAAGNWDIYIKDPPDGGFLFEDNDICRVRATTATGVSETWFKAYSRADEGDGTQSYSCETLSGASAILYPIGGTVIDYGVAGDGFCTMTAELTGAPYYDVATHTGSPWDTFVLRARLGNLDGITDPAVSPSGFGIYTDNSYIKGTVSAACGNVLIDDTGVKITACDGDIWDTDNTVRWTIAGSTIGEIGGIRGTNYGADTGTLNLRAYGNTDATDRSLIHLKSISTASNYSELRMFTDSTDETAGYTRQYYYSSSGWNYWEQNQYGLTYVEQTGACGGIGILNGALYVGGDAESITGVANLGVGEAAFTGDVQILGGLHIGGNAGQKADADSLEVEEYLQVGACATINGVIGTTASAYVLGGLHVGGTSDPGTDNLMVDGTTYSVKGGTDYSVYGFHPLNEPFTNTTFNGDSFSTVGSHTKIENTSWSTTIPANAKALAVNILAKDSGAAGTYSIYLYSTSSATNHALICYTLGGDLFGSNSGVVPCTDGDIWYRIVASGTNTLAAWLRVTGYWI